MCVSVDMLHVECFFVSFVVSMTDVPQWQNNRPALESSGDRILEALKKGTAISANPGESPPLAPDVADRCFKQLAHSYEEEYGGFRDAPKFPTPGKLTKTKKTECWFSIIPTLLLLKLRLCSSLSSIVNLMFLMTYWSVHSATTEGVEALQMALHTLRMMALGGIHDHIAQVQTIRG